MRTLVIFVFAFFGSEILADEPGPLRLDWSNNFLSIRGDDLPGGAVRVWYLEAICRPGSTDRDWNETVIPHQTRLIESRPDGTRLTLRSNAEDGVVIDHVITASKDEVDFRLTATNPTDRPSEAHWAQPCMRVAGFTGCPEERGGEKYLPQTFIFLDGKLARLPTQPWADRARYTPGQVYCPKDVPRSDVNPRPLSTLVPSDGLIGCYSQDGRRVLAMAWEPYQELFQGVIVCLHSDFRIGGLAPGQSKTIRGKIYIVDADIDALLARYRRDFPEHHQEAQP